MSERRACSVLWLRARGGHYRAKALPACLMRGNKGASFWDTPLNSSSLSYCLPAAAHTSTHARAHLIQVPSVCSYMTKSHVQPSLADNRRLMAASSTSSCPCHFLSPISSASSSARRLVVQRLLCIGEGGGDTAKGESSAQLLQREIAHKQSQRAAASVETLRSYSAA